MRRTVVAGRGWDVQLTEYGDGYCWTTFFVTGMAHFIVGGSAWEHSRRGARLNSCLSLTKPTSSSTTGRVSAGLSLDETIRLSKRRNHDSRRLIEDGRRQTRAQKKRRLVPSAVDSF
jgi:hypothetical protein